MSNEELERRINNRLNTIVENQARFSEDMLTLKDALLSLTNIVEQQGEQIKDLTENMNALIRVVERHVSNHPS